MHIHRVTSHAQRARPVTLAMPGAQCRMPNSASKGPSIFTLPQTASERLLYGDRESTAYYYMSTTTAEYQHISLI